MRATPLFLAIAAACASAPALAIEVDGRIDAAEWAGAQHITDFRMVQPLTREPSAHPTEAWILSTPEGLAIGFRNIQPESVPRTRQKTQRDAGGPIDRVNLYVDFDGDGRGGYNFTVTLAGGIIDTTIANENQFNGDWDGDWQYATSEDGDTWSAEMLIPWHIAPMRKSENGKRSIGISLDRVIGSSNERMAWPAISFTETRFLSELAKVEVEAQSQQLLAITPYVVGVYDNVNGDADFDGGADIFWKPSGQFQLSATLNPDFGQVESDQLVVNFGAIETFFNDKRPFFTENQAFFDVPFGSLNNANRLIYTRRVGGPADDGNGSGDVTAAVKLNGSAAGFNYGVFAATEADEVGRDFFAARASRDGERVGWGGMVTRVDRPFLDRVATVYSLDHRWRIGERLNINAAAVASNVEQADDTINGSGGQLRVDHEFNARWRQQVYLLHLDRNLQLNDFGFLERNNFNYLRYEVAQRITDLPEDSRWASHQWRYAASTRRNDSGLKLWDALAFNRFSERRDGGNQFWELAWYGPGHDDLISRGNGAVQVPAKFFAFIEQWRPKQNGAHLDFYWNGRYGSDGLDGIGKGSWRVYLEPGYHVNDSLRFFAGVQAEFNNDWLLWQGSNLLASFESRMLLLNAGMTWLIGDKQELRVRLEAIGLDAEAQQAWRIADDGRPLATAENVDDFALRRLGFQIRYRYELAPLSHLYVAYVRGGALFEEQLGGGFDAGDQFTRAFDLRDSEQLLIKLSYRFTL
ncbi:MAG TPA: DUF5916 domain-containing protein [Arenimonas sp.]|nr:DUF5916 domain-containing protein [Arenimonas sp.]